MESLTEVLLRSFTRYFMPGLVFLVIGVYMPLYFSVDPQILDDLKLLELPQVFIFSIVIGYLLDCLGAYSWTLSHRQYEHAKDELANQLQHSTPSIKSIDPDQYLGELWLKNEKAYSRLFLERAEWVMILESSCALLFAGIVCFVVPIIDVLSGHPYRFWESSAGVILLIGSRISSVKGIQRMRAHNAKAVQAVSSLAEDSYDSAFKSSMPSKPEDAPTG